MKKFLTLLLVTIMVVACFGCSGTAPTASEAPKEEAPKEESPKEEAALESAKPLKFISITQNSTNASAVSMNDCAKAVFEAAGAEFTALYYDEDYSVMCEMIANAVTSEYDGMILMSYNNEAGLDEIRAALDSGMVISLYDGGYDDIEDIQYSFSGDNYNVGHTLGVAAGDWANENLVANGITPIVGVIDFYVAQFLVDRSTGILEGLKETCPEAQVVASGFFPTTAECMSMTENWLQEHPDMNMVVGIGDTMVLGSMEALAVAGKDPAFTACFGCDAIDEVLNSIADPNGFFKGTIDQGLGKAGTTQAEFLLDAVNGVEVEGREKYNYFDLVLITKDNVDQYLN